jgi:hypothetical protein
LPIDTFRHRWSKPQLVGNSINNELVLDDGYVLAYTWQCRSWHQD